MKLAEVEILAKELMEKYGCDYELRFNKAVRVFGNCNNTKRTITLSEVYCKLNSEQEVRDTILHEIAHFLTPNQGHNQNWKRKAIEIGCSGEMYVKGDVIRAPKKYKLICDNCGKEVLRYRKAYNLACGKCCKEFNNGKYTQKYLLRCEPI